MQERMIQIESEGFSLAKGDGDHALSFVLEQEAEISPAMHPLPWRLPFGLAMLATIAWLIQPLSALPAGTGVFPLLIYAVPQLLAVIAAMLIFAIAWHTHDRHRPGNILFLACGVLAAGMLDAAQILPYFGMSDFVTPASTAKAAVFPRLSLYAVSFGLLAIAWLPWRPLAFQGTRYRLLAASVALPALACWLALSYPQNWPAILIEGKRLAGFAVAAACGGIVIALAAAFVLYRRASHPQPYDAASLCAAAVVSALSELCFTMNTGADDMLMLLGLLCKIVAYYFIYRVVFGSCVRAPYRRLRAALVESKSAEHLIDFLAYHDPLTKLPNRLLLKERLERAIGHANRTRTKIALLYLDLDNFKAINDCYGHAVGDALLKGVAARLSESVRGTDTISRRGGDEFVIVLQDVGAPGLIVPPLQRMMERIQQPFDIDGHQLATAASIGIAVYPDDGGNADTLLKKADMAMYHAKAAGRNTHCFFDENMNVEAVEILRMRNGLSAALIYSEFLVHYQPKVDLASGAVVGAEALIRWRHPELGMVPPGRFIPIAEDSGLIVPIGEWILREACRQAAAWRQAGLPPLVMAVNLSSVQFMRSDVERTVIDALKESGLHPSQLELELTESILIQDTATTLNTVKRLKALGVKLSIDDFGTGYSSLSYLKRFDVDRLKIDQSFIRDLAIDQNDAAIVRAIIQMAHNLGLRTVAEGVEDASILNHLKNLHCDEAQGYYFAKPMAAEDFAIFVEQHPQRAGQKK